MCNPHQQKRLAPYGTSLCRKQQPPSLPATLAHLINQRRILNTHPMQVRQQLVQPLDVRVNLPQAQLVVAGGFKTTGLSHRGWVYWVSALTHFSCLGRHAFCRSQLLCTNYLSFMTQKRPAPLGTSLRCLAAWVSAAGFQLAPTPKQESFLTFAITGSLQAQFRPQDLYQSI